MKDILFISFFMYGAIILAAIIISEGKKKKKDGEEGEAAKAITKEIIEQSQAYDLVKESLQSLTSQCACGYGPWLSSIVERAPYETTTDLRGYTRVVQRGACPKDVALEAMRRTKNELFWRRFDLSVLNEAICILERM